MPFDWQAQLSATVVPATPARVWSPPSSTPKAAASFAQVLSAALPVSSNDNLPHPYIRGETLGIKMSQKINEKVKAFCKHHLRGRLVLNKGDKPYMTRDIELKLQKL